MPDETHERLLIAAGEVFAEQGFQAATIRDICTRAGTNVAAVNYHFGDKLALYSEVLAYAVNAAESEAWRSLDESVPPEEVIRMFIFFMFRNFHRPDKPGWHMKLMMHEVSKPSPALVHVIETVIRPNFRKVSETIARIIGLPADHDCTRMCVFSIVGQIHFYIHGRPVIRGLWPEMQMEDSRIHQISTHIASFTLAALHGLAADLKKNKG
jgi:AcrR family transcriptional regulator